MLPHDTSWVMVKFNHMQLALLHEGGVSGIVSPSQNCPVRVVQLPYLGVVRMASSLDEKKKKKKRNSGSTGWGRPLPCLLTRSCIRKKACWNAVSLYLVLRCIHTGACGSALRGPHCGPAPNVQTWIKRKCSHWCVRTCGPACGEKSAECHAVISRTRKLFFGLFMTFWGLEN